MLLNSSRVELPVLLVAMDDKLLAGDRDAGRCRDLAAGHCLTVQTRSNILSLQMGPNGSARPSARNHKHYIAQKRTMSLRGD